MDLAAADGFKGAIRGHLQSISKFHWFQFPWHTQQSPHEAWSETSLGSPEAQLKAVWRDTVVLPVVGTSKWKSFHKKVQSLYFLLNISSPTPFLEGSILDSRCLIVIGLEWNDWVLRCLASWPLPNHPLWRCPLMSLKVAYLHQHHSSSWCRHPLSYLSETAGNTSKNVFILFFGTSTWQVVLSILYMHFLNLHIIYML